MAITHPAVDWLGRHFAARTGRFAVYAKDLESGAEILYHADEIFPSASLIKVPIMLELYRRVEEDGLSLDRHCVLRVEDQVGGSGVLQYCTPGTRWRLRDLIAFMIAVSDNTATNLLIDCLGIAAVNATTTRLGLLQTELVRRLERLPQDGDARFNHTTARDMGRLMEAIATGKAISHKASQLMRGMLLACQGPLLIAPELPDPIIPDHPRRLRAAHKTGSLSNARHDAGIVYWQQRVYVAVVLSYGAPEPYLMRSLRPLATRLPRWLRHA